MNAATNPPALPELSREATELLAEAHSQQLMVRVVGSTGIHLHCAPAAQAMEHAQRSGKDIDLIVRGGDRKRLRELIERRGYLIDRDLLVAMEGTRYSFAHPASAIELDVFVDRMEFCHTIDLTRRFELHPQTIPVEDLLLAKLQVHDFTRNDLLDAIVLLGTHPVLAGAGGPEEIDGSYIAALLARDWGFHHTVTANLTRVQETLAAGQAPLEAQLVEAATARALVLARMIEDAEKSRGWRLRARVGERMQWWEDVDERVATY